VRLIAAPGGLRDVELEVFGWRTEHGETMVRCRLVDGSMGTIPARWTDLPRVSAEAELLWWGSRRQVGGDWVSWSRRCGRGVRGDAESPVKTEVSMSGQLALGLSEVLVAAAMWESLPPERQREVTIQLARLLARLVEAERDE
jgi:hypothetical protein